MVRLLFLLHRYLGIAVGFVMLVWTVSGIIMMYQEYPELDPWEQRSLLGEIDTSACCELPAARMAIGETFREVRVEMLGESPVLRLLNSRGESSTYYLDSGVKLIDIDREAAQLLADEFVARRYPGQIASLDAQIFNDQWTVYGAYNPYRPLFRYQLNDKLGTEFYISSKSGEIVQLTTARERLWGYLGAVIHWLYPTVLRQHTAVWAQVVIWLTILGIFLTTIGLYIGVRQYRARSNGKRSPYRGMALFHHYGGLVFGILTLTWVTSGLFSMNPWGALEGEGAGPESARLRGGELSWGDIAASILQIEQSESSIDVLQYRIVPMAEKAQLIAYSADNNGVRIDLDSRQAQPFGETELRRLATRLQPGIPIRSQSLLGESDTYYYQHHARMEFPVYRVIFADDEARHYYLSPVSGEILKKVDAEIRWYRWVFYGLHRGDFTALLRSRPLWDIFMVLFLLGVTVVCATGTIMAYRRVRRDLQLLRHRSQGIPPLEQSLEDI